MTEISVRDNPAGPSSGRYEIFVDGALAAFTQYRLNGSIADFVHTETLDGYTGRGLAGELVGQALDDARKRGWQVRPDCPYVRSFIAKHSEYVDLVPQADRARYRL
jgi:predicted GNAT family acetyltransferase